MKTKAIIIMAATALTTVSCLDEEPKSQLTEEQAFENSTALYKNTVATLYNYIGGITATPSISLAATRLPKRR